MSETDLAHALAPIISFDEHEPLPFTDVAITALTPGDTSPSAPHTLNGPGTVVIEYALWGDLEIGHAYELEHIWVYTDESHQVLQVDASAHGSKRTLNTPVGTSRPELLVEPGKHGLYTRFDKPAIPTALIETLCTAAAGTSGVLNLPESYDQLEAVSYHRGAWLNLRNHRFRPTWRMNRHIDVRDLHHLTWSELDTSRTKRSLSSISPAWPLEDDRSPIQVPADDWGSSAEAWVVSATYDRAGRLLIAGLEAREAFEEAQHRNKLLLVTCLDEDIAVGVDASAWDAYASAHTIIITQKPTVRKMSSRTASIDNARGRTDFVVANQTDLNQLTIGPGGDIDTWGRLWDSPS